MKDNQEEPITPGCPSLMPHNLPGGIDGVEPGEDKEPSAVKKYPPYDDRALPKKDFGGQFGTYRGNNVCNNISLCNIDISLRRIADSIDCAKRLDEKIVQCSKLTDDVRRLSIDRDMYHDDLDKVRGEVAHLRSVFGVIVNTANEGVGHNEYADKYFAEIQSIARKESV